MDSFVRCIWFPKTVSGALKSGHWAEQKRPDEQIFYTLLIEKAVWCSFGRLNRRPLLNAEWPFLDAPMAVFSRTMH